VRFVLCAALRAIELIALLQLPGEILFWGQQHKQNTGFKF